MDETHEKKNEFLITKIRVFRFPFSVFRFPFSVFRFPFSVFGNQGGPKIFVAVGCGLWAVGALLSRPSRHNTHTRHDTPCDDS